jgi:ABC-type transporter Mla subunit MlaD
LFLQEAWSSRETELLEEVANLTEQLAQQSELAAQAQLQLQQQGAALEEAQQQLEELSTQVCFSCAEPG